MTKTLFRSRAMSRNAGPEKLDERIRVVTVTGWISLGIGVVVALSLLAWAALSTISVQVSGAGLLVREPYTFTAESPSNGYLAEEPPPPGTKVRQGQQIGLVSEVSRGSDTAPVVAPIDGTILSLAAEEGAALVPGQDIAYLETSDGALIAQAFVPTADGKRVTVGMPATVAPSTAAAARYGELVAKVTAVTEHSLSADRIRTVAGSGAFARQLANGPPVLMVTLALQPVPGTDRYAWTAGDGPPFAVNTDTLAQATITIASSSPIDLVFGKAQR
ncbi:MAG TPA: HlyD family efflux transporter periplasmic adaptor subunit [Pilimelia sp.]|nr:HlyD family efflux transporter periplasmic adaptor subunit [Pilimelia sp.]